MEEKLVLKDTAVLAKEKGFEGVCKRFYSVTNNTQTAFYSQFKLTNKKHYILAPTQSLLQKWLREVHNIEVYVTPVKEVADNFKYYQWMIHTISFGLNNTYEEALEAGLIKALKLIK